MIEETPHTTAVLIRLVGFVLEGRTKNKNPVEVLAIIVGYILSLSDSAKDTSGLSRYINGVHALAVAGLQDNAHTVIAVGNVEGYIMAYLDCVGIKPDEFVHTLGYLSSEPF
jgi:hypothetical protein